MNLLNPLATAGLVVIGIAQIGQIYLATQPTPQETHFRGARILQEAGSEER